jgi:hypothetical protein
LEVKLTNTSNISVMIVGNLAKIWSNYIQYTSLKYCHFTSAFISFQSNTSYVAGCRDSGVGARTDLYDVLVNLPAREITVAPHAKGNKRPCCEALSLNV